MKKQPKVSDTPEESSGQMLEHGSATATCVLPERLSRCDDPCDVDHGSAAATCVLPERLSRCDDPCDVDRTSKRGALAPASFAPGDPGDGRVAFDYKSRWGEDAQTAQRRECWYLMVLLVVGVVAILATLYLADSEQNPPMFLIRGFLAGILGGTAFDMKWWYHAVAKGSWHMDRRGWRFLVPWVSGLVAMFMLILVKSGLVSVLDTEALNSVYAVLGLGFLAGYFSDSAVAKLADVTKSLFGASSSSSRGPDRL